MDVLYITIIKLNIVFRKKLLNLLLLFSPRKKIMIRLSQNLDKYIVLYQKELYKHHKANKNSSNNNTISSSKTPLVV